MIPVYAISTGKIETLNYDQKRPMHSALNKTMFSGKMWLSYTGFSEDEQAYKTMVVHTKLFVVLVRKIIQCIKMILIYYLIMQCLVKI